MKNELVKIANDLDEKGLHEEANQIDSVIKRMAEAEKEGEEKKDEDKKDEDKE